MNSKSSVLCVRFIYGPISEDMMVVIFESFVDFDFGFNAQPARSLAVAYTHYPHHTFRLRNYGPSG